MRGFDMGPTRFRDGSDAIPTRFRRDSDAIPMRLSSTPTRGARRNALYGGVRPDAPRLVVEVRVIINRHPAIFFRLEFIIFRMIHLDFMCLVDEKPEIIPELIFVSHALCHNMT